METKHNACIIMLDVTESDLHETVKILRNGDINCYFEIGGKAEKLANSYVEHDAPQSEMIADYVTEVTVIDPDSQMPVEVAIYKDKTSGGIFGVDCSFLQTLSDDEPVIEPFNGNEVMLIEGSYGSQIKCSEQGQLELPE